MDKLGGELMLSRRQLMNDKIVSAQGENLSLVNVKGSKLNALLVYGKSTQSGTPGPDNPVPIVSAGSVMTTGAQLFDIKKATPYGSAYGLTISIDGENIEISGTVSGIPSGQEAITFRILDYPENLYGNRLSMDIVDSTGAQGSYVYGSESENALAINFNTSLGAEVNLVFRLMVNSGSTALPWEPYTGGVPGVNPYAGEINVSVSDGGTQSQTLTLSTPGGLPGIPVTSGGNYTDESGQQWVCDEIDLKRGKYVKRVEKIVIDGEEMKFTPDGSGKFWNLPQHSAEGAIYLIPIMSMYFPRGIFLVNNNYDFIFTTQKLIGSYFSSVNEFNEFCTEKSAEGQPLELYYGIDPIETDLPAEEIAAYQALHTYTPNTTVSNDTGAWVKVGYREWRR